MFHIPARPSVNGGTQGLRCDIPLIWIVDDDLAHARIIRKLLGTEGYEIVAACSGAVVMRQRLSAFA
jgi:hypothetical protein